MKPLFIIVIIMLAGLELTGQTKFEREYRIDQEAVPVPARALIDDCCDDGKIKWYAEESEDGKTYEAKTRMHGHKYSIEFTEGGELIDAEKKVSYKQLDESLKRHIENELCAQFNAYRLDKVQVQYLASQEVMEQILDEGKAEGEVQINYEIVLEGWKGNQSSLYEMLFDKRGNLLETSEIILRDTENLDF